MKITKAILLIILYGIIYYFYQFVIGAITGAAAAIIGRIVYGASLYEIYKNGGMGAVLCITVILSAIFSYVTYWFVFLMRNLKITKVCNFKKLKLSYIPPALILGVSICFLNSSLIAWLGKIEFFKYYIQIYQYQNSWLRETNTILLVLAIAVTAPLIEEIIFRGMIFNELKPIIPAFLIIIIQGLLFGIYHFNIVQFIYGSFLGIMFGLVYYWTQNLWIPIILHFSNNIMAIIAVKQQEAESASEANIWVFLVSLIITALLCFFFYKRRSKDYYE